MLFAMIEPESRTETSPAASDDTVSRIRVGNRAPDVTLVDPAGATVRLADLIGGKVIVLYFYPRDETAGCTIEACAFRDAYQDFVDAGAEVIGVSRDDGESHRRFAAAHQLPFRLLSDVDGSAHRRFGVKQHLGGLVRDRISFVIDRAGVVRMMFDSKLRFQAHVGKALEVVRTLAVD